MLSKKMLLIINPVSGRNKARNGLIDLANVFSNNGYIPTVFSTRGVGDATEIVLKHARGFDLVVCRGGDGTFSEILNGLMRIEDRPPVGFVPAGTTNDLADTFGISTDPRRAAATVIKENALTNDIGLFNGRYFTSVATFGFLTESSYATPQNLKNRVGRLAYFLEATKEVKDIHAMHLRVKSGDFEEEGEYVFGAVSSAFTIGKIIKLDPRTVSLNDGKFEVFLAKHPGSAAGWRNMLWSVVDRSFDKRYITMFQANSITLESIDGEEIPWSLDGEFGGYQTNVDIKIIEKAYRLFRPRQNL